MIRNKLDDDLALCPYAVDRTEQPANQSNDPESRDQVRAEDTRCAGGDAARDAEDDRRPPQDQPAKAGVADLHPGSEDAQALAIEVVGEVLLWARDDRGQLVDAKQRDLACFLNFYTKLLWSR